MATTNIYLHQDEPTEPAGDGTIKTSIFDDAETEYSGGAGFLKYFTSEAGFFTFNQNLKADGGDWTIHFNCKVANPTAGYIARIFFYFYKRDTDNNDTEMFVFNWDNVSTFYSAIGFTATFKPETFQTGSDDDLKVTTSDRLRIGVRMNETRPV